MSDYIPVTEREREEMLAAIGVKSVDELFEDIPVRLRSGKLKLPEGLSQQEVYEKLKKTASLNRVYRSCMRGAGAYRHYIPSVAKAIASRSEFVTAYTPYQAEMSQGILGAMFEYQTYICLLTGMDVSNASLYNGATAAAEAALMTKERGRYKVFVTDNVRPDVLAVMKTYLTAKGMELNVIPSKDGATDVSALKALLDASAAAVYVEQPNYFGLIEDLDAIGEAAHAAGAKFIAGCNPIALAVLKTPAECGADIAVGEGQPLGMSLAFGGPYLGFIACKEKEVRKLPGRIVGETVDKDMRKAYVLTLQPREQHIRRERASSNICSNEALCALTATVYMGAMGREGMREAASACTSYAHYAARKFAEAGLKLRYDGEFFHEFVTVAKGASDKILTALDERGILGGLRLNDDELLWCFTELNSKDEIDEAATLIGGAL